MAILWWLNIGRGGLLTLLSRAYFNAQRGELRKARELVMFGTRSLMKLETTWITKRYNFRFILI